LTNDPKGSNISLGLFFYGVNMKGKKIIKKEIILVLSEKEAELLKALIQNPLFDSEQPEVSELRRDLFESLTFED
jgi:hypothetical protein